MQKINPFSLPRPVREVVTREFNADGASVTLSLRKPDAADMNRAAEAARKLVVDFIEGDPELGRAAADFFDGIKVSEGLFLLCASAEEMQPPDARLYSAIEFVILLDRLPTDGPRIAAFIRELQIDWRRDLGNSRGVPTGSPAAEHSTPPTGTQSLTFEQTPSSAASTTGSANSAGAVEERIPVKT